MRCLYCGRQLALFRKLTGGGQFCSDAHRQSYQDEYNRLALSRLLQSQSQAEEGPAAPPLPPPSQRLQMRAGSILALEEAPPAPSAARRSSRELAPLPPEEALQGDARKRADFVTASIAGLPGTISTRLDLAPLLSSEAPAMATPATQTASPALRERAEYTIPLRLGASLAPPQTISPASIEPVACAAVPAVPDLNSDFAAACAPVAAAKATVPIPVVAGAPLSIRINQLHRIPLEQSEVVPRRAVPAQGRRIPVPVPPKALTLQGTGAEDPELKGAEPVAFPPSWAYEDTLGTGFVAGLKLGEERIRFALPRPAVEAEPLPQNAPEPELELEPEQPEAEALKADDAMLPPQFISAVQGDTVAVDEAKAMGEAEARGEPEDAIEPEATEEPKAAGETEVAGEPDVREPVAPSDSEAPESAVSESDVAGAEPSQDAIPLRRPARPAAEWQPLTPAPVSAPARQRLMQTFHAIGMTSAATSIPEFEMIPLRPKFILGRAPDAVAQDGSSGVAVAEVAVETESPRDPASEAAQRDDTAEAPATERAAETGESAGKKSSVEEEIYASSLAFLSEYEKKKSASVLSKFLGKIGLTGLLFLSAAGAWHAALPNAEAGCAADRIQTRCE